MRMNKEKITGKYEGYNLLNIDRKTGEEMVFYKEYLDKLIKLFNTAITTMNRPHVIHLRLKLEDGIKLKEVMDRIVKHFRYVSRKVEPENLR